MLCGSSLGVLEGHSVVHNFRPVVTMLLQVGYGLVHDLWAISAALGDVGLGCVAIVQPQLDVGTLHRHLHKAHVPGIHKVLLKLFLVSCKSD